MVENLLVSAVFRGDAVFYVVVRSVVSGVYLAPYAVFDLIALVRVNQIGKLSAAEVHEIVQIFATDEFYHFVVCEQHSIVVRVSAVDEKSARQIFRNVFQSESEFGTMSIEKTFVVSHTAMSAAEFRCEVNAISYIVLPVNY